MIAPRHARRLEARLAGAGARWERLRYPRPAAGGEVSACRFVPAGAPRGRVVLAHGAGNDALYPLLALVHPLLARGFELFCFDLDGHGRESTTRLGLETVEDALAAAAERASSAPPDVPLHLVGHSLGGSLVLHALATGRVPSAASAVVISAPTELRFGPGPALAELRGFLRRGTLAQREHYGLWGLVPAFGRFRRGAYPLRIAAADGRAGTFGYVETVRALLARLELERAAERIRVPLLLVYGTGDRLVPQAQGERLARAVPGTELALVEGATHWSTVWSPETVERVVEWLEAKTAGAAA